MIYIFSLLAMIFLHIVGDYYLQGVLAKMKQRQWWENNAPDKEYRFDYIPALIAHAFSWTFMIMLPAVVAMWILGAEASSIFMYCFIFVINWIVHALTDHAKANEKSINLIVDQCVHFVQIIWTWLTVVLPVLLIGLGLV